MDWKKLPDLLRALGRYNVSESPFSLTLEVTAGKKVTEANLYQHYRKIQNDIEYLKGFVAGVLWEGSDKKQIDYTVCYMGYGYGAFRIEPFREEWVPMTGINVDEIANSIYALEDIVESFSIKVKGCTESGPEMYMTAMVTNKAMSYLIKEYQLPDKEYPDHINEWTFDIAWGRLLVFRNYPVGSKSDNVETQPAFFYKGLLVDTIRNILQEHVLNELTPEEKER